MSGSVARMTAATTVSAPDISRVPNLMTSLPATRSTRPQASHNGASSRAGSCTARNVTGLKPRAKPTLCAASATVSPSAAAVHRMKSMRG